MGGIKDSLDHIFTAPEASTELSEAEVMDMQVQALESELRKLYDTTEEMLYKDRYYAEKVTYDQLLFVNKELMRIIRNLT